MSTTVPALFLATAAAYPDRVALRQKRRGLWRETTWADYRRQVCQAALGLRALGLRPGDRVAVIGENGPEWVIADLATLSAGGVTVGVYPTSSWQQCEYVVGHAGATILVLEGEEQLDKWLRFRERTPAVRRVILWDREGLRDFHDPLVTDFADLLQAGAAAAHREPGAFEAMAGAVRSDDLAVIVYTSGTTGPPKGAMLSHANLAWIAEAILQIDPNLPIGPDDQVMSFLPLCHIFERLFSVLVAVRVGYTVNFVESLEAVPSNLREIEPTIGYGVPRMWEKFASTVQLRMADATWLKRSAYRLALAAGRARARRALLGQRVPWPTRIGFSLAQFAVLRKLRKRLGLHRMRIAFTGAAPIAPEVLEFFHALGLDLVEGYGQTESSGVISATRRDRVRPGTVGQPLPGLDVRIAEDGEILVRSPGVFQGYYADPAATATAIDPDGWLRTGDVGTLDAEGNLRIVDRKKDLIITAGGKNVAPQYLENKLKFSPYIADAVVIGDRRPYLTALVVLDEDTVVQFARDHRIPFSTYTELADHPEIVRLVEREVESVNRQVARVETVRRFRILPRRLYEEDGEVTPTMKVKRTAVNAAYGELIEAMYAEGGGG